MVLLSPNLALMHYTCPGCCLSLCVTAKLSPEIEHAFQQTIHGIKPSGKAEANALFAVDTGNSNSYTTLDKSKLSYSARLLMQDTYMEDNIIAPLKSYIIEAKEALEEFKNQIDATNTVDDAIKEIGPDCHREKRDV